MGFQQGLSGLNATSKNLEVIGNNIANANTYGAKSARAEFSDMYASAMNGPPNGTNSHSRPPVQRGLALHDAPARALPRYADPNSTLPDASSATL